MESSWIERETSSTACRCPSDPVTRWMEPAGRGWWRPRPGRTTSTVGHQWRLLKIPDTARLQTSSPVLHQACTTKEEAESETEVFQNTRRQVHSPTATFLGETQRWQPRCLLQCYLCSPAPVQHMEMRTASLHLRGKLAIRTEIRAAESRHDKHRFMHARQKGLCFIQYIYIYI